MKKVFAIILAFAFVSALLVGVETGSKTAEQAPPGPQSITIVK